MIMVNRRPWSLDATQFATQRLVSRFVLLYLLAELCALQ